MLGYFTPFQRGSPEEPAFYRGGLCGGLCIHAASERHKPHQPRLGENREDEEP